MPQAGLCLRLQDEQPFASSPNLGSGAHITPEKAAKTVIILKAINFMLPFLALLLLLLLLLLLISSRFVEIYVFERLGLQVLKAF